MKIYYYIALFFVIGCSNKPEEKTTTITATTDKSASFFSNPATGTLPASGKCNEEITLTESDKITDVIQGLPPDVA